MFGIEVEWTVRPGTDRSLNWYDSECLCYLQSARKGEKGGKTEKRKLYSYNNFYILINDFFV